MRGNGEMRQKRLREAEVVGSNPVAPTNKIKGLGQWSSPFFISRGAQGVHFAAKIGRLPAPFQWISVDQRAHLPQFTGHFSDSPVNLILQTPSILTYTGHRPARLIYSRCRDCLE